MPKALKWKFAFLAFLLISSVVLVLPSFYPNTPQWFKKYIYQEGLKLGLDLQGGMHLILKVDVDQAVRNAAQLAAQDLKDALKRQGITIVRRKSDNPDEILIAVPNKSSLEKIKEVIEKDFPNLVIKKIDDSSRFPTIALALSPKEEQFIREHAVEQSLEIIRNRIDQFGVTEPVIVRQGEDEIVVQLPGIKDPKRAIKLIGQTAQLEFKLVDDDANIDLGSLIRKAIEEGRLPRNYTVKQLNAVLKGQIPRGDKIYIMKQVDSRTGRVRNIPILLKDKTLMTGDAVKTAHVRIGGTYNEPYVALELTDRGARIFEKITGENVGKRLAIVLDGVVRSAPVIREKIGGGHAQISGSFTHEEAADLAIVLRAGALPAPVKIIQNVTVGPSLGRDSIRKGLISGIAGAVFVMIFMVIYYRLSGFIADVAVLLNLVFLMAVLALFQATLTLPGIAGIILTIGMGVDSNVLIFERMREEKALGKPLKAFIDGGYDKAFWTIVDAHVTTLITALALFLFGTGPIKGFAVTLSAGIIINLFTAIYATRWVYEWLLYKNAIKDLSFMQIVGKTNIDFIGKRHISLAISAVLVLTGIVAFVQINRGAANLGVDFAGGTMVQYKADKPFALEKVRQALAKANLKGYALQEVPKEHILIVRVKKSVATVGDIEENITKALKAGLPDYHFTIESKTEIGSTVSKELRRKAIIAILISLAGIIGYLAFRFNISFGVAAAIATFHDVLAVLGVFYLLNKEINLLIVTALLTLAGYSLTDTVVVFDRIRENLKRYRKLSFAEIINKSVNEMLSRTIITSLTTLIVVLSLYFFGGVVIHDFAFALVLGIIVGTYSSVFVASPIVYIWHKGKAPK
ncbi:MAG: protein translocase subunit SecD [Thermodesulfobacteria bacterium]|nr:protein translocase subunit SecD [Thermodesulfobacteriota bacterium]